jgi:O-succinylbenzoic acid--CoA ligase
LHSVVQTSGSEGEPKGVCLTFSNHLSNALASALNLGVRPDDRWLLNMPMDRVGGLAIVMRAAIYGTTVVIHDRFDAEQVWRSIDSDGVTQLSCVATTLRRILEAAPERQCPAHVRTLMVGGGPVPESLMDEARHRGFPILPTYGLTETSSQIATLSPASPESKRYTAGCALPLADIEIRDDSGGNVPSGTAGRIHARGPMVSSGYWVEGGRVEMPLDSDGWLATNDIGSIDEDGYLTVHGRIDNVIISGGIKIHAEEIENALMSHEAVARTVVVAVDDAEWGQSPLALVERKAGVNCDGEMLRNHLADKLPKHALPRRFGFVDVIPTLPSGKADRQALRARHRT